MINQIRCPVLMCVHRYDKLAFRYVAYVTIPCLAAYTVYSLLYETHRGWYSFVISTLTSFVYMFGFVSARFRLLFDISLLRTLVLPQAQLVPQLIINYKLKVSVFAVLFG